MFLKKHKNKIIAAVVIAAVLAVAWFYGGNYNRPGGETSSAAAVQNNEPPPPSTGSGNKTEPSTTEITSQAQNTGNAQEYSSAAQSDATGVLQTGQELVETVLEDVVNSGDGVPFDMPESEDETSSGEMPEPAQTPSAAPEPAVTPAPTMDIDPAAGLDRYQTDPVPTDMPEPVEPQDAGVGDGSFTVTLTVRCDTILDNINMLNKEKHELVPADGVVFPTTTVTAYEGESVFNILQREMRRMGIHMTFRNTPIYNSAYIEAINNLYEFDVGELSGWMYCVTPSGSVNAWYPNYGCSRYQIKPGDAIEWNYTCDLGRDLGENGFLVAGGGQANG